MKMKVFVLGAKQWTMEDDNQKKSGVVITDKLDSKYDDGTGLKGYVPVKQSVSVECFEQLVNVPAYYDIECDMKVVGGKPQIVPTSFNLCK
ncbi:hypothetical protein [Vallitalea guaymasensis]|uniref:hypothetical protein n=1 Tax=Vallitalea guaymasensis TaxID=1185412 RepID=UPI000DE447F9|nr:hypothetical protein [Vallitalea guaymasensis]